MSGVYFWSTLAVLSVVSLWWVFFNRLQTSPRVGRHARTGAVATQVTPATPIWLRKLLMRALLVFGILALMTMANYLSEHLFGYSLGDVGDLLDDYFGRAGGKTLAKTLWQPLPMYIFAAVAVILALMFEMKRLAGLIVVAIVGITMFHYLVPTKCWSKDTACIAAEKAVEQAEVREKLRAEYERQSKIPYPGVIPQMGAALFGSSPSNAYPECDGKTERPFRYELDFKEVPQYEHCGITFKMKDDRTYEIRYRDGHMTVVRDGPGKTITIDPYAKEVRAIGAAFDAYIVLYPPQSKF